MLYQRKLLVTLSYIRNKSVVGIVISRRNFGENTRKTGDDHWAYRLKSWLQPFVTGSVSLWSDYKSTWSIRKQMRKQEKPLSAKQRRLIRHIPRDIKLAFPLVAFFCIPIIGYVSPLVGLKFPRILLPPQFWTDEQQYLFSQESIDILENQALQSQAIQYLRNIKGNKTQSLRPGMSNDELLCARNFFSTSANLRNLSRGHILLLVKISNTLPWYVKSVSLILPKPILRNVLQRQAIDMRDDDHDIIEIGIESLSSRELLRACYERNLPVLPGHTILTEISAEQKNQCSYARASLTSWLQIIQGEKNMYDKEKIPLSMVLHGPLLQLNSTKY